MNSVLEIYGKRYQLQVQRPVVLGPQAPRLVVVAYQPNQLASWLLRLCLESIRRFTPEPHELWVVDNCSPAEFAADLFKVPDVNVILNLTKPTPKRTLKQLLGVGRDSTYSGSYANAVALEIAARIINPSTEVMMTLHMDTMACHNGWLSYLRDHLGGDVRCVGVRMDTVRGRTVHVLGMMFDFQLFRELALTFGHDMPRYDVGDAIPQSLERAGYRLWACRNTLWQPDLVELMPHNSPYRRLPVDRSLNDENEVIFLHLGRGILKSSSDSAVTAVSVQQWLDFGTKEVLSSRSSPDNCNSL